MNTAIITKTGERVEIVAVNGGWTTVQTMDAATREFKVRNGALSGHAALSGMTAELAMQKAEQARVVRTYNADGTGPVAKIKAAKAAKEPKAPRAKMDISERKNGAVDPLYLPQYETYSAVRKDGTKIRSIDKGDAVAKALRGQELVKTYADVAAATGVSVIELRERFCHLNPGMQRMNLGNMLRRATR
jgi:hypothetical protein